jgi:diguanylate cyclase (GGDEF)-like protein
MINQPGVLDSTPAQRKNERFFLVMYKFSIVHLLSLFLFTVFFVILGDWSMVWATAACTAFWFFVYINYQKNHNRLLFNLGGFVTTAYAIIATLNFGWSSGFYFLVLSVLPLTFLNIPSKKIVAVLMGLLLGGAVIAMHIISLFYPPTVQISREMSAAIFFVNLVWCIISLAVIGYFFEKGAAATEASLVLVNKRLNNLASTDPVTNLANRRTMLSRINQEKIRLERTGEAFSLIMIDIDNFKVVNDEYGHDAGDFVLVTLAAIINFIIRKQDHVARWGGDEFLVFLPETGVTGARVVAEKIRARILTTPFIYREMDMPVTVTLGVSECDVDAGIGNCIRKADIALYAGKQAGKNRVTLG